MIAVVDDEESVVRAVVRLLRAAGFAARGFLSGDVFLKTWHFDRPDYLLLDLQMSERSGMEILQALRIGGAQFPIAIMTADDAPATREECMRLGASAYLRKPLDIDKLFQTLRPDRAA